MTDVSAGYLLSGQSSELQRLQLQSRVWEPAGRSLMREFECRSGACVLEVGCGVMGWLRVLSEWVGPEGEVVGTDVDERLLDLAQDFVDDEGFSNVRLVRDDIFDSALDAGTFDLVHARFQIAPLGRGPAILSTMERLLAPGGRLLLEDPDSASWHFNPPAPALEGLIRLIVDAFQRFGGDFDAGRVHRTSLRDAGFESSVRSEVMALEPGHPYLALPLQFSSSLEPRLVTLVDSVELDRLRSAAASELADDERWGTTFTLLQTVGWRDTANSLNDPAGR
jgi:ubiquinone/menaquinone biosynthesis C-methylase UbiE